MKKPILVDLILFNLFLKLFRLGVTPKTTEQHLIAHSDKYIAYVTNNKDCARRFVLLKLTTDRHEASRGSFAIAELLV